MNEITEAPNEGVTSSDNEECGPTCPETCKGSLNHKKCVINKHLEVFVKAFVSQFENKLNSYREELIPGKKTNTSKRPGKAIKLVSEIPIVGKPIASTSENALVVVDKLVEKNHRDKVKRVVEVFRYEDKKIVRKMLVEAGGDIFKSFEKQFLAVTDTCSRARAKEKLAKDAMDRVINYIDNCKEKEKNLYTKINVSVDLITKGVILGRSNSGHTVQNKISIEEQKTSEIYEKTGIIIIKDHCVEYYKSKANNTKKYGHRLPLKWELEEWNTLKQEYETDKKPPGEHKYILESEEVKEKLDEILAKINEKNEMYDANGQKNEQRKEQIWFNIKNTVVQFTGREKELSDLHNKIQRSSENRTVISQTICIAGMGGIGKSELARKYAHAHQHDYDGNIIWINAENRGTLEDSFLNLAKDPRVNIPTKDWKKKTIEIVVKKIYIFFSDRKSLFIFDNAETFRTQNRDVANDIGIDKFLPFSFLASNVNKPTFLITSRNQEWGNIDVLQLDTFTEEEAAEFIRNALNIEEELQDMDIKKLAEKLQNFPLVLKQAVAYIKEKKLGCKYDISDYLKDYDEETEKLLDFKLPDDSYDSNLYTETTLTTWKITFDKISNNEKYGKQARQMLDMIAYFAPDNIPTQMFLRPNLIEDDTDGVIQGLLNGVGKTFLNMISWFAPDSERVQTFIGPKQIGVEKLDGAVQLLKKYSILNSGQDKTLLNVHRLIQQVIRINLKDQNKENNIVRKAFKFLEENFPYDSDKLEDYTKQRQLLPHLEAFLFHIDNWVANKSEEDKRKIEEDYLIALLTWMGHGYGNLGNPRRQNELLERSLEILKNHYGSGHLKVALTLVQLGDAHGGLGDPQQQRELQEQALKIQIEHYGPDHLEVARTQAKLGNAYYMLGDPRKQKELQKQALKIQEDHYGPDHNEVATTLVCLGNAYGYLGNVQKKKELLERALNIQENHYPGHFIVARTLVCLGHAYFTLGDPRKQKELQEKALKIQKEYYGADHFEVARTLVNLGNAYGALGDAQKKKESQKRALKILEEHYGPGNFLVAGTLVYLGTAYGDLGNVPKKKELLERALNIEENHYGPDNFLVATTLVYLGNACGELDDRRKQQELQERALKIQKDHYGPDHFIVARTLVNLGNAYGSLGNAQKQKELQERALKILEVHYGPDHFIVARTLVNLGNAYGRLGNAQKQKELQERALKILEEHFGPDNFLVATTLMNLGNAYSRLGNAEKQKKLQKRAWKIREKHYGPDHIMVARTLRNLSIAYEVLGKYQKKNMLQERASKIEAIHYGPPASSGSFIQNAISGFFNFFSNNDIIES